jgi:hypothetical protein
MQFVEQHCIDRRDPRYAVIDEAAFPRHTQRDESKQAIEKNDDKSLKYQRGKSGLETRGIDKYRY